MKSVQPNSQIPPSPTQSFPSRPPPGGPPGPPPRMPGMPPWPPRGMPPGPPPGICIQVLTQYGCPGQVMGGGPRPCSSPWCLTDHHQEYQGLITGAHHMMPTRGSVLSVQFISVQFTIIFRRSQKKKAFFYWNGCRKVGRGWFSRFKNLLTIPYLNFTTEKRYIYKNAKMNSLL